MKEFKIRVVRRKTKTSIKYLLRLATISCFITYGAKLLNADWLRQRAFFLNHEGTFGNQEGMIT